LVDAGFHLRRSGTKQKAAGRTECRHPRLLGGLRDGGALLLEIDGDAGTEATHRLNYNNGIPVAKMEMAMLS
jgi:hypothetical protein